MKLKQIRVDGYKNLIDCVVNLGDFNVLVGPNNSGKSNLLEIFPLLAVISTGDESILNEFLNTAVVARGPIMCHLHRYKNRPIRIGFAYEMSVEKKKWNLDYEISFRLKQGRKEERLELSFIKEALAVKPLGRPGPSSKYFDRKPEQLTVLMKNGRKRTYKIAKTISSVMALKTQYSEYKKRLPKAFGKAIVELLNIMQTSVLAIDSVSIRLSFEKDKPTRSMIFRAVGFNLLTTIDGIYSNKKRGKLYEELLCDILDLEYAHLYTENIAAPSRGGRKPKSEETLERVRRYFVKKKGDKYSNISEYSDGTFAVAGVLAAVFSKELEGPILCIEEPENYLHPRALKKLLRFLQDHADEKSVLITTHSPYLLNCVNNPEDVNVALVDKTGAAHFKKVHNTKQLRDYLKSGFMSFGDMLASNFEEVLGE